MKKKLIVIFFLAIVPLFIIYKLYNKTTFTYLAIGDALAKGHTPFDTYNKSYVDYLSSYLESHKKNYILNKDFIDEDIRIKDLTTALKSTNNSTTLSQNVKNADIITLSIGSEELFSKLRSSYNYKNIDNTKNFEYVDLMFKDLDTLIKELRRINKKDIYIIGYYNPLRLTEQNETYIISLFNYLDIKFNELEKKYKIKYIKINDEFINKPGYLPSINNAFPSLEGYNYIANEIIKNIK